MPEWIWGAITGALIASVVWGAAYAHGRMAGFRRGLRVGGETILEIVRRCGWIDALQHASLGMVLAQTILETFDKPKG